MTVWLCIPSKREPEQVEPILKLWRERGYKIALFRDHGDLSVGCDLLIGDKYQGYAASVNLLAKEVLAHDTQCDWVVSGGDDTAPDPNKTAEEIARECTEHFSGTFGVMQPTGDRYGENASSHARWPDAPAYIDRVAGSPWMGRDFCQRMYGGKGPLFEGYRHCFVDEELQNVAKKLEVFWQRRDLIHMHQHWARVPGATVPSFLREATSRKHWDESKALFESRQAAGFPESNPIA